MPLKTDRLTFGIRQLARIGSVVSIATLLMFAFGGEELLNFATFYEFVGFCLFPVGIMIGMAVAWRYELWGGLITIASLVGFYIWHLFGSGRLPSGLWFLIFASPALLFLATAIRESKSRRKVQE